MAVTATYLLGTGPRVLCSQSSYIRLPETVPAYMCQQHRFSPQIVHMLILLEPQVEEDHQGG